MRLTVNILHIPKFEQLIENNALLKRMLKPDAYGGWYIDANDKQLAEICRQLDKNGIKYKIK